MSDKKDSKKLEDFLLDDLSKSSVPSTLSQDEVTNPGIKHDEGANATEQNAGRTTTEQMDGLDPNLWSSGNQEENDIAVIQTPWEFEKDYPPTEQQKSRPKELPIFEGSDPEIVVDDFNKTYQLTQDDGNASSLADPQRTQTAHENRTQVLSQTEPPEKSNADATVAVAGLSFQSNKPLFQNVRVAVGQNQGVKASVGQIFTSADASLVQAENLRIAQQRILDLEKEIDQLRYENDQLGSAGDVIRQKYEDLTARNFQLEKERSDLRESFQTEVSILKGKVEFRDMELVKAKNKVDEYEQRLKQDFKKIRIREKELENRVELMKVEQTAITKSKDEQILDLKRKMDHLNDEIEVYRSKVLEFNKTIESQQEQFKRAIRALRVAFSSLEGHGESTQENVVPLKKAE
jgi:hypothetical protein